MTAPAGSAVGGLADALNILLDKGLVIDATIKVSIIGIEIISIEARIVISSVDTYIRYLEAMQRLNAAAAGTPVVNPVTHGIAGTLPAGLPVGGAAPLPVGAPTQVPVPVGAPTPAPVNTPTPPAGPRPTP